MGSSNSHFLSRDIRWVPGECNRLSYKDREKSAADQVVPEEGACKKTFVYLSILESLNLSLISLFEYLSDIELEDVGG